MESTKVLFICIAFFLLQSSLNAQQEISVTSNPATFAIASNINDLNDLSVSLFVKSYVESRINKWQVRGEFEPIADYTKRVNQKTRQKKIEEFTQEALTVFKNELIEKHSFDAPRIRGGYDIKNQSYLIEFDYIGQFFINVPVNEAASFRDNFTKLKFDSPDFVLSNDRFIISDFFVVDTLNDKAYKWSIDEKQSHGGLPNIVLYFDPIDDIDISSSSRLIQQPDITQTDLRIGKSDVAVNIPETNIKNKNTFAVIIANQNYEKPSQKVKYAINDGRVFKEYCIKTLGVPKANIHFYPDATSGRFERGINRITNIAKAFEGEAKIIFYYAGHGTLDQSDDKSPYLLPIDVSPFHLQLAVKLEDLYDRLSEHSSESVLVFLDACFSGANRGEGMVVDEGESPRFVVDEPKFEPIKGNMVVFSAASGKETAWPYRDKQHGLFTYYLLKKLQETKGDVDLGELYEYIRRNVLRQSSGAEYSIIQTPQVIISPYIEDEWQNIKLR